MNFPFLSRLSSRLRLVLFAILGILLWSVAGVFYLLNTTFTTPPPVFQDRRAIANTDVNPYSANFFLEREVEAWKRERTVRMAREAGIGWARQEFIWAEIEPEPGNYNWTKYDEIVDLFRRNNIQVIARLDRPPAWARSRASATGSSGPPDDFEAYGKFVEEFTGHFQDKIYYLQIWNEPNLSREWNDAPIDPVGYTRLLKIAYQRAKSVNPNVQILSAPLAITLGETFSPGSPLYRNMNDLQFLEEMYAAGAKDYFDILSANAFGLGSPPDDPPNPGKLNFQRVLLERAVMEKFGDAQKAIWILEYGWNAAPESIPDSRLIWGRVTEQQQADYTVRGIELARENWDWAGVVSIWFFRQVGDIPPNNPEAYFRMVDLDFTPRPVFHAVSAATKSEHVANPGEYEETNPALMYQGNWLGVIDANASAQLFMRTSDKNAKATLRFYGEALDLVFQKQPGAGRLFITLDGRPVNGLPRDETGQTFVEQANSTAEWRAVIPIARNLARAEHLVELRAEGDVNLDGFIVAPIAPPQPPWIVIGILGALGIASLGFAVMQVRARR
jgi:polysaccharide biosynthesis protein PslG